MQALNAQHQQQTMPMSMVGTVVHSENAKIQHILNTVDLIGLESSDIYELVSLLSVKALEVSNNSTKPTSDSNAIKPSSLNLEITTFKENNQPFNHLIDENIQSTKAKVEPKHQESIFINKIDHSESLCGPKASAIDSGKPLESKSVLDVVLRNKFISIEQINDAELLSELLAQKTPTRRIAVDVPQKMKGVRLEFGQTSKTLVIKGKSKGIAYRCVLNSWTIDTVVTSEELDKLIGQYINVGMKLKRKPTTTEFNLHTQKVITIGDAMRAHIEFNINNTKGEGSNEWKRLEALTRNHLSKPKLVTLPNKQKRQFVLTDESLYEMTKANFECYLKEYKDANGTYDTIVSRVKAAINFCIEERLIDQSDFFAFHQVARLGKERYVEVYDKDLIAMFKYLEDVPDQDFYFFMYLEMTGHFRTNQTLSLKYSDFDFNHNLVKVEPKNGKFVEIPVAADIIELVKERQVQHIERFGRAEFLFPSKRSASGHRETFKDQWDDMRVELGFYHADADGNIAKDKNGKTMYKYRLHDFRETLLGRIHDLDDPTLAALLGHLSLHALKHYRKADRKRTEQGAKIANERLKAITENN